MAAFELSIALGAFVKPSKVSLRALEWLKKVGLLVREVWFSKTYMNMGFFKDLEQPLHPIGLENNVPPKSITCWLIMMH